MQLPEAHLGTLFSECMQLVLALVPQGLAILG